MRLLRYSRLIDEINEDQLDDQMDDEGSGSDSENSEVQGSTDSLPDESMEKCKITSHIWTRDPIFGQNYVQ